MRTRSARRFVMAWYGLGQSNDEARSRISFVEPSRRESRIRSDTSVELAPDRGGQRRTQAPHGTLWFFTSWFFQSDRAEGSFIPPPPSPASP